MLLCHPVISKVEESVQLRLEGYRFQCVVKAKTKITAPLLSGSEILQLLYCICITMARSPSSCYLTGNCFFAVLQVRDGDHKASVVIVQGKMVKQSWESSVVLISKHL